MSQFKEYLLTWHGSTDHETALNARCSKPSWIKFGWIRQSNEIKLTEKKENQSNPNKRSIFELVICVKQALKRSVTRSWKLALLEPGVYSHVFFRKQRNSAEMASDALCMWIVSFKCVVKGFQECRFDLRGKIILLLQCFRQTAQLRGSIAVFREGPRKNGERANLALYFCQGCMQA